MSDNPYESPKETGELGPRWPVTPLSPLRIPLAVVCTAVAALFARGFWLWCGRLGLEFHAILYVPMTIVGFLAFGAMACGLLAQRPGIVKIGLAAFVVTYVVVMVTDHLFY